MPVLADLDDNVLETLRKLRDANTATIVLCTVLRVFDYVRDVVSWDLYELKNLRR